jgi:negative regulator of sigma E activity
MKPELELKLQAWLDGELPAAEAEQARRLAAAEPEAARLLAELQAIKTALRNNEEIVTVPETREFYWSKIERRIQREAADPPLLGPFWAERFRRWLVPLAGAAALAAMLLVALSQFRPQQTAFNQVSGITDEYTPRTFRDKPSGINFVVFQATPQPSASGAGAQPARTRNDGSSFMIDHE